MAKNDDTIGLAIAGLLAALAVIFGPNLLKGFGGSGSSPSPPPAAGSPSPTGRPPLSGLSARKKSGCSACSAGI